MYKKKADESFTATLLAVQKEMAKPTMAASARRKKTKRAAARVRSFRQYTEITLQTIAEDL
jgi:hypothetical protein